MAWAKIGTTVIAACMTADVISVANTLKSTLLCDTFTSDNWDDLGTQNQVNTCTAVLDWDFLENACSQTTAFDLGCGAVSDSQWVLRFKWTVDNITNPSSGANLGWVGVYDENQCSDANNAQDFIAMRWHRQCDGESQIRITDGAAVSPLGAGTCMTFSHANAAETIWIELRRTSTTVYTARLYLCACYNELIEQECGTVAVGTGGLRYIKVQTRPLAPDGGTLDGTIDDMRFYNGTDTPYTSMGRNIQFTANTVHCGNARPAAIYNGCMIISYSFRENLNGTETAVTATDCRTAIALWQIEANPHLITGSIVNNACEENIGIFQHMDRGSTGAAALPNRAEVLAKWDITTEAIGKITIINDGGSGSFDAGSSLTVWATC